MLTVILALGRVGSGQWSLMSSKTRVGSGWVRICVGRVGSKKLTRVHLCPPVATPPAGTYLEGVCSWALSGDKNCSNF